MAVVRAENQTLCTVGAHLPQWCASCRSIGTCSLFQRHFQSGWHSSGYPKPPDFRITMPLHDSECKCCYPACISLSEVIWLAANGNFLAKVPIADLTFTSHEAMSVVIWLIWFMECCHCHYSLFGKYLSAKHHVFERIHDEALATWTSPSYSSTLDVMCFWCMVPVQW